MQRRLLERVQLRTVVHSYVLRTLLDLGHPATDHDLRTLVVGPDPLRVLLFGSGVLVGYGMRTRHESIDGELATRLADRSGRGVVLENRAVPHIEMEDAFASLGGAGFASFGVAVWSPAFLEIFERLSMSSWRHQLTETFTRFRAETSIPIVVALNPLPLGRHPAALISRPFAVRLSRTIREVAERFPDVHCVETEPIALGTSGEMLEHDGDYYARLADRVAPVVLGALDIAPDIGRTA